MEDREKKENKPKERANKKTTSHHSKAEGNYSQFLKDKKKAGAKEGSSRGEKGSKAATPGRFTARTRDGEGSRYSDKEGTPRGYDRGGERGERDKSNQRYGDKPKRIGGERAERGRGDRQYGDKPKKTGGERRSFNPNFTQDNKLIGGRDETRRDGEQGDYGAPVKQGYGERGAKPKTKVWDKAKPSDKKRAYADRGAREESRSGGTKVRSEERRTPSDKGKAIRGGDRPDSGDKQQIKSNYPKYPRSKPTSAIRLNRYLAMSGVSSRREADELIKAGVVSVNGVVVTELGTKVEPEDVVKFNDSVVKGQSKVYILMNKPKGFVTTVDDPHATKTVMDIIKNACNERVYPVGRLDKDSMGVLLFTNDGDLTKRLTHPSHNKKKVYQVMLDKAVTKSDMEQIVAGVELEDGTISADAISYVGESKREVGIEIHSGRNRIVRRVFEHLGYSVISLDRVFFAGLTKKNLRRGAWRFLTVREVEILKSGQYE